MTLGILTLSAASLDNPVRAGILELARQCSTKDLSRGPWLRISSLFESSSEVLAATLAVLATNEANRICGVALVVMDGKSLPSCQLLVAPQSRRKGLGRHLLQQAMHESNSDCLRVWNHGNSPDGHLFATSEKLRLLQSLAFFVKNTEDSEQFDVRPKPRGEPQFEIRSTTDLHGGWREVVTQAYKTGRVVAELEARSWWANSWGIVVSGPDGENPAGILVARTVSYLLRPSLENHVMAVAPRWQGAGISKLLLSGLTALAVDLKIPSAISYVVASNHQAVAAHKRSGFSVLSEDSVYLSCRE